MAEKKIVLYFSSVVSSVAVRKNTERLCWILESRAVPFERVDISSDETAKEELKRATLEAKGKPGFSTPTLIVDGKYFGNFEELEELIEMSTLNEKLGIPNPPGPPESS
eukprot:CAMPEP_0177628954 /NCGR_PEP_ID=MMETSP0447-20121125/406_1 /TAXON_ID=0 /ORGANISM="Stygamoeba regulata, Strain BSH-02190019" /LENGTH=108 /DNA_ID=CAMNT_0019130235 /DNA_START=62 /DNA_END=388 /DNA_ORIENTATION=-